MAEERDVEEVNLYDAMARPLSDSIIQKMAEDEEDRKDLVMVLLQVNPRQANLISRMLKTLGVENYAVTVEEDENAEDSSDVSS